MEVAGIATVATTLVPAWRDRVPLVGELMQPDATEVATGITVFGGIALVLIGRGVAGRRRMAWLLVIGRAPGRRRGQRDQRAGPGGGRGGRVAALALFWQRHVFSVRPASALPRRLIRLTGVMLALDLGYGLGVLAANSGSVQPALTMSRGLRQVALGLGSDCRDRWSSTAASATGFR